MKSVRHVSKLDGDGAGYDICSFNADEKLVYIEVKSTTGKRRHLFICLHQSMHFMSYIRRIML